MDTYNIVSQQAAKLITTHYSSSFGLATRAFPQSIRAHIYNIYGLVRVADEIVDSYEGPDQRAQLEALETEVCAAIERGYSSNVIVHAFQVTAQKYAIDQTLLGPFFTSMRTDIDKYSYSSEDYQAYIHGSAEVIGLMCLKVFVHEPQCKKLSGGAMALGAAFQKVNFLRDLEQDHQQLGRFYFPGSTYETFDDAAKQAVVADIYKDLAQAKQALVQLPRSSRAPVMAAYRYFLTLLRKLEKTPVTGIKQRRIRINNFHKILLLIATLVAQKVRP